MGILGCSSISTKNIKKQDLYLHCYVCDSLGVEKSVFSKNETIYFGCVIRNVSDHPIIYTKRKNSTSLFSLSQSHIIENDSLELANDVLNWAPDVIWSDNILKPEEQLFEIQNNKYSHKLPTGKSKADFHINVIFVREDEGLFNTDNTSVKYTITERD